GSVSGRIDGALSTFGGADPGDVLSLASFPTGTPITINLDPAGLNTCITNIETLVGNDPVPATPNGVGNTILQGANANPTRNITGGNAGDYTSTAPGTPYVNENG